MLVVMTFICTATLDGSLHQLSDVEHRRLAPAVGASRLRQESLVSCNLEFPKGCALLMKFMQ